MPTKRTIESVGTVHETGCITHYAIGTDEPTDEESKTVSIVILEIDNHRIPPCRIEFDNADELKRFIKDLSAYCENVWGDSC